METVKPAESKRNGGKEMEQALNVNIIPENYEEDELTVTGKILSYTMTFWTILYVVEKAFLS